MRWIACLLIIAGCTSSHSVTCGDVLCPEGSTCGGPTGSLCIAPGQLGKCDGKMNGEACDYVGGAASGVCIDGVCFAPRCGDGYATGNEKCDGNDLASHSCGELGYYVEGGLACTAECQLDESACAQSCGDHGMHILNGDELCDGNPPERTCAELGYDIGMLGCTANCGPDFSGCDAFAFTPQNASDTKDWMRVWAASPTDAYAVARDGSIGHWDGVRWELATSPTTNTLYDVWGASAADIFAVGAKGTIIHFDGQTWTAMASGTTRDLHGVWGTSGTNVYAVGDAATVLHYGSTWTPAPGDMSNLANDDLRSVHGTGATDVWFGGVNTVTAGGPYGITAHYNGASLGTTAGTARKLQQGHASIERVFAVGPNDVYAVGSAAPPGLGLTSSYNVVHFANDSWTGVLISDGRTLTDVWAASANDVFVVGAGGLVMQFDGTIWRTFADGSRDLFAITGFDRAHAFAAGAGGTHLGFAGTQKLITSFTTSLNTANAVVATTPSDIYVVGSRSSASARDVIHHLTTAWTDEAQTALGEANAICVTPTQRIVVGNPVGTANIVQWTTASPSWTAVSSTAALALYGVWCSSEIWAVGYGAAARHWSTATGWETRTLPGANFPTYRAVWGAAINDIYAVGDGVVAHYNGTSWQALSPSPGGSAKLFAIYGTSATNIWVVGEKGLLLHFDGSAWTIVPTGVTANLDAIWLAPPPSAEMFIGGDGSTLLHSEGGRGFVPVATGIAKVTGIAAAGSHVYIVGESGFLVDIMRTAAGGARELRCDDYLDDDADGKIDACDDDCSGRAPAEQCANGFDDDCDGTSDCADPDCVNDFTCK